MAAAIRGRSRSHAACRLMPSAAPMVSHVSPVASACAREVGLPLPEALLQVAGGSKRSERVDLADDGGPGAW